MEKGKYSYEVILGCPHNKKTDDAFTISGHRAISSDLIFAEA